ncbi:F-box/kelch-repeat protein [Rosa sericea]
MAEEVVVQILSRLPPKSLMRFKCVRKSWCALVNNPGFISQHLHLYNKFASTPILIKRAVICRTERTSEEVVFSLLNLHNDDYNCHLEANCHSIVEDINFPASMGLKTRGQFIELPMPRPRSFDEAVYVIGHCDGIICLLVLYISTSVILCNPAIKEFRLVKDVDVISFHVGFGYDPKSKDYILVNVMSTGEKVYDNERLVIHPPRAKLYTLGTGSWREINTNYLETETTNFWPSLFQFYFKGIFYWLGNEQRKELVSEFDRDDEDNNRLVILFYDTGDELFHSLLLPDGFYDPNEGLYTMRLALLNESIALYGFHCIGNCPEPFEIWIMVDFDGTDCSWTKQLAVVPTVELYMPGAVWKNNAILINREGRVVSYNFDEEKLEYNPIHGVLRADFQAAVCVHSIVSVKGQPT